MFILCSIWLIILKPVQIAINSARYVPTVKQLIAAFAILATILNVSLLPIVSSAQAATRLTTPPSSPTRYAHDYPLDKTNPNFSLPSAASAVGQPPITASVESEEIFTYTDSQGRYTFLNLEQATHKVYLDLSTLPAHLRVISAEEESPLLWVNPDQRLTSAATSSGVRFTAVYNRQHGSIEGVVFWDENGNGQFDPHEAGLPNVKVIDPGVQQYIVPFDDTQLNQLFQDKVAGCYSRVISVTSNLISSVFLTAGSNDTIVYYDHWEDGYDPDPINPAAGSTTQINVLDAGATQVYKSNITPAQVGPTATPTLFDGRDRITVVGAGATVVRQVFPENGTQNDGGNITTFDGVIAAAAWDVLPLANWGTEYIATVGEDLNVNGSLVDDHAYTGVSITTFNQDNVTVYRNGTAIGTISASSPTALFIPGDVSGTGGVQSGDVFTATAPIQVQMMSGHCSTPTGFGVSAHGYTLQPANDWTNRYWVPTPGFEASCAAKGHNANVDTDVYIHNPNNASINVTVNNGVNTVVPVPANQTISLLSVLTPTFTDISTGTRGVFLSSDRPFWGMSVIDSTSNKQGGEGKDFDWGYSLIPEDKLSSQVVMGYSPGTGGGFPVDNGNMAFVVPTADTVIRVDLDQDGIADKFDINGDGDTDDTNVFGNPNFNETTSNAGIPVSAGQVLRVGSPTSRNLQGAIIYTNDIQKKIAVSWGQDPCRAAIGSPYLDLGYTALPASLPILSKNDELIVDTDNSGSVTPGDVVRYTIELFNNSIMGNINNPVLTDTLPFTYTDFIVGSIKSGPTGSEINSEQYSTDGTTFSNTPDVNAQQLRFMLNTIGPSRTITLSFEVRIRQDIPDDLTEISNVSVVGGSNIPPTKSVDPNDPFDPDTDTPVSRPQLVLTKRVSPQTIRPGQFFTYTIVVSNSGTGTARNITLSDTLPAGVHYVANTLDITYPYAVFSQTVRNLTKTTAISVGFYEDTFEAELGGFSTGYSGSTGTLNWLTDWIENDPAGGGAGSGRVSVPSAFSNSYTRRAYLEMRLRFDQPSITRRVNLATFTKQPTLQFFVRAADISTNTITADDFYSVLINGTPVFSQVYTGTKYVVQTVPLAAFAGNSSVDITFQSSASAEFNDHYYFDNILVYEADRTRSRGFALTTTESSVAYTSVADTNPLAYNPTTNQMVFTNTALVPAKSAMTLTFVVSTSLPLTNGIGLTNSAVLSTPTLTQPLVATAPVRIISQHALTLTKTAQPDPVRPGQLITYTIVYQVGGDDPAPNVIISDTTPPSTTFVSASGGLSRTAPPVNTAGLVTWQLGNLLTATSGITYQTGSVMMTVRLDPAYRQKAITNVAVIRDDTGLTDTAKVTVTVAYSPVLELQKRSTDANGDPLLAGERLNYTLVVTNSGGADALGVVVSDTVPLNTTYLPGSIAGGDSQVDSGNPLLAWTVNTLASDGVITLTYAVVVTNNVVSGTRIVNTAVVTAQNYPTPTTSIVTDTVKRLEPKLVIQKASMNSGGDPLLWADRLIYTMIVSNVGDITATNVTISDTVPLGAAAYVPGSISGADSRSEAANPVLSWTIATLPVSRPITVSFVMTNTQSVSGTRIVNTASVTSSEVPTPTTSTVTDTVKRLEPKLVIQKASMNSGGDPLFFADRLTYTMIVSNVGDITATNVTVSDTVPLGAAAYIPGSISGADSRSEAANPVLRWTIATLPVSQPVTISFVMSNTQNVNGFNIVNTASVTSSEVPTPTTSTVTDTVVSGPRLLIDKRSQDANGLPLAPDERLTYTIVVSNVSNTPATNVTIRDTVPTNSGYVPGSIAGGDSRDDSALPNLQWQRANLAAKGLLTLTFAVTVNANVPTGTTIINRASVTSTEIPTPTVAVVTNTVVTPTQTPTPTPTPTVSPTTTPTTPTPTTTPSPTPTSTPHADVGVTKKSLPNPYTAGQSISYDLVVRNAGPYSVTQVTLRDNLPTAIQNPAYQPSAGTFNATSGLWQGILLNPGDQITLTIQGTVAVGTSGLIKNTAVVTSPLPDPNPKNNEDTDYNPTADIDASKRDRLLLDADNTGDVTAGDTLLYTVLIRNRDNYTASQVVFTDLITDPNLTLVSGSATTSQGTVVKDSDSILIQVGDMSRNSVVTVTFRVKIAQPLPTGVRQVANQGVVSGENFPPTPTDDPDTPNDPEDPTITPIVRRGLAISKVVNRKMPVYVTEEVTYAIRITNTGNTTVTVLPLDDVYEAAYLSFARAVPAPDAVDGAAGKLSWNDLTVALGDLRPGQSVELTVVMTAIQKTPQNDPALNTATVTKAVDHTNNPLPPTGDDGQAEVDILPNISLTKRLNVSGPVGLGERITFTIKIVNTGRTAIVTLPLSDSYDSTYLQYAAAQPAPDRTASGSLSWDDLTRSLGDVPVGGSVAVQVAFTTTAQTTQTVNVATSSNAKDENGRPVSDDDRATVVILTSTDLQLSKIAGVSPVAPGQLLTYTIRYLNNSSIALNDVTITETVPLHTTFVPTASTTGWACLANGAGNACTFTLGNLPIGGQGELLFAVRLDSPIPDTVTTIVNTVLITSQPKLTKTVTITTPTTVGQPAIQFTKQVSPQQVVQPGDSLTYTLCYVNAGSETATNVVITDSVPFNTVYVPSSASNRDVAQFYDGATWSATEPLTVARLRWQIGDVPADNVSRCVSFRVTVNTVLSTTTVAGQGLKVAAAQSGWRVVERSSQATYLPLLMRMPNLTETERLKAAGVTPTATTVPVQPAAVILPLSEVNITIPNTAILTGKDVPTRTDTVTNTVLTILDPIITKASSLKEARVGDLVTYTITILNPAPPGNITATNLAVVDGLPLEMDYLSFAVSRADLNSTVTVTQVQVPVRNSPSGITQTTATTVTLAIPTLGLNERVTLTVRARVNQLAMPGQPLRNLAIVSGPTIPTKPATVVINVPVPTTPTPTKTATATPTQTSTPSPTPKPPDRDDKSDDDDDDGASNPPPPSSSSPPRTSQQPTPVFRPTPTPVLPPVGLLPETGTLEPSSEIGLMMTLLLMGVGVVAAWLLYGRRR